MSTPVKLSKADVVTDFRRSQILDAAREAFARHGLAGTTVDGIAKRAGVAKGTVYLYYRSKDEILRQILETDLSALREDTVPVVAGDAPLQDRLVAFLQAALTFFDSRRDFFEHAHYEMAPDVRRKALQRLELVHKAQVDAWRAALAEGQRAGVVGPGDVHAIAAVIVALASGLARQRLRGWSTAPVDVVARDAGAAVWHGLAAR